MITAQNILEALAGNVETIRFALGAEDWAHFFEEIVPLRQGFASVTDRDALEIAADPVWQVCRRYPFIEKRIREYSTQSLRKLEAGRMDEELPIREIVNRFQSLFTHLENMNLLAKDNPQKNENRNRSGTTSTRDR